MSERSGGSRGSRSLSVPLVPADYLQLAKWYSSPGISKSGTASPATAGEMSSVYSGGSGSRSNLVSAFGPLSIGTLEEEQNCNANYEDDEDNVTTSTSSYAGSDAETAEEEEEFSAAEYVTDKIIQAFDGISLDRAVVIQAQSSGLLNSTTRELEQLHDIATKKIQKIRVSYSEGIKSLREVQKDLKWVQRRVDTLKKKASEKYGKEYARARELIPEIIEHDD
ncbi:hypothetical protein V1511DRAFT_524256 [Dipodascopsis uninucleata]